MRSYLLKISILVLVNFSFFSWAQTLEVTLDLTHANTRSETSSKFLILPVPLKTIAVNSTLTLLFENKIITAKYFILNKWPALKAQDYIRVLLIELPSQQKLYQSLTLRWQNNTILSEMPSERKASNTNTFIKGHSFIRDAHLVSPELSWLTQALLLHPKQKNLALDWYIEPQKKYANYVTDQILMTKNGYPKHKASQWLYDRPQAIYQLYLMSGEEKWLAKADQFADFYIKNIDETGKFILKKQFDPKMLMPKGVLYRYLLSGDLAAKEALHRMFTRSLAWDESYSLRRGFWTERNQAAALNVAVSYWELTNDAKALKRINDIIDATVEMTFYPENGWSLRGCPQHSFKSHEGWGDNSPACSPWMMALLGDALWRFYQLTDDVRAGSLIDTFGDFILNHGIYYGNARVKNIVIPKYIVSINNPKQEEKNQWTDPQHACDVAALLGKSAYIKKKNNQDNFLVKTLFNALLEQCAEIYTKLKKVQHSKGEKKYWLLKPPRRFGWMYSTTSDLPWLNNVLLNDFSIK